MNKFKNLIYIIIITLIVFILTDFILGKTLSSLLKIENIDRVELGMTKSQVRYLLGGPVIGNPYQTDRWDYIYLYQERMSGDPLDNDQRYWLVVYFENERVTKIERDVLTRPEI